MALDPDIIKPDEHSKGCVPHGPRITSTTAFSPGKNGELRRCPGCKKWWFKDPEYTYIWQPVHWYHFDMNRRIREHERRIASKMHTLVDADVDVED